MPLIVLMLFLVSVVSDGNAADECPNVKTSLGVIRKRRHLVFPDSSNVVLTISLVKAIMTHAPSGWNIALEIDVMFPLPDEKFSKEQRRRKYHRQKREFWKRLENAIDFHNLNGRACIFKSICESKIHLAPPGKSLVHDILRAIFSAPIKEDEEDYTNELGNSYGEIFDTNFCERIHDCPFSILNYVFALNKERH